MPRVRRLALPLAAVAAVGLAAPASGAKTYRVKVDDDVFTPSKLTVRAGSTVRWTWVGENIHNVVVTKGPQRFRSGTTTRGTYTRKLRKRGRYSIVCTIHYGMNQTIRVR